MCISESKNGFIECTRFLLLALLSFAAALVLAAGMGASKSYAATTGTQPANIVVSYGVAEDVYGEWNEGILTVDGTWSYCVDPDTNFQSGR